MYYDSDDEVISSEQVEKLTEDSDSEDLSYSFDCNNHVKIEKIPVMKRTAMMLSLVLINI